MILTMRKRKFKNLMILNQEPDFESNNNYILT